MAVRAGRPSSGSGGLEAYAIPIFALIVMAWLVRRLGPLLAARISRLLVGEETPLDFANKGKLKGKKRVTKATPASALLRSPSKKSAGSPTAGAASSAAQEEVAPVAASKATGPASYQESAVAPLAAVNDQEAQATAKARNDSVEWTVNESKKPKGGGSKLTTSPRSKGLSSPSPPEPPPEPRHLRFEFEEEALRRIAHGLVTHEARIEDGDWKGISAGDYFVAFSATREVTIEIMGLTRHSSFGGAWSALGPKLLPAKLGLKTAQHADEYFAQRFPRADLAMGVVAFQLQVIFCEDIGGGPPLGGGAGGSSSSADACALPPSASPQQPENGTSSSGSGKGKAKAPLEQTEGASGNGKGKQPYRRPGKGPASPGRGNGKAPAGKAPARESD